MTEKKSGMSIRIKLLLSYFIIVFLIVVVGVACIFVIREVYSNGNDIYVDNLKSVEFLKSINQNVKEIDQCVVSMMTDLNDEYHETYKSQIDRLQQANQSLMEKYEHLNVTTLEKRRYNQCRLSILTFDKMINSIVENIEGDKMQNAVNTYEQELMPVKACTYELVEAVVELSTANAEEKNNENRAIYKNTIWIVIAIFVVSIIVAVTVTLRMSNYFTEKLETIKRLAKRISEYNVSDDIEEMENDEFGDTMQALNDSQFMMRDLLEKIIDESATISETGEEVSLAVRKSNQRIENVNVKIYDTSASIADFHTVLKKMLEHQDLDEDLIKQIQKLLEQFANAQNGFKEIQSELTSIAMYLEQVGITSDYQNEIANSHKEQVQKFKV